MFTAWVILVAAAGIGAALVATAMFEELPSIIRTTLRRSFTQRRS